MTAAMLLLMANLLPLTALEPSATVDVPAIALVTKPRCHSHCVDTLCTSECVWYADTVHICADPSRVLLASGDGKQHCISLEGLQMDPLERACRLSADNCHVLRNMIFTNPVVIGKED